MSKTLTEQWREGKLSMGYYYVSTPPSYGGEAIRYLDDDCSFGLGEDIIQEVLAPVPSYEELTLTAGNYRLAKKALRDCYNEMKYWATMNHRCSKIFSNIKAALVEIEEVK